MLMGELPWHLEATRRACMYKIKHEMSMTEIDVVSNEDVCGKTMHECEKLLKNRLYAKWQEAWDASVKGRVTYEWIRSVGFASKNEWFDPRRSLVYFITGHGSMNAYLHERNLTDDCMCGCGEDREDWKHMLCKCKYYEDIRDMDGFGVCMSADGKVSVDKVLCVKEYYERVCTYADRVRGEETE